MTRLPPQPAEQIDRNKPVTFMFDGKKVTALEGDTIGSALYAAGQRTFSRSFKYHRRRGLMCCAGQCPNCLVAVDGAPGIRACAEPVREGAKVEHMNARPSLEHDVMAVTDAVGGPFTPPGFYYKTMIRPRRLWPTFEKILRNAAGIGKLPEKQAERTWRTEYRRRHTDVLVVGGGAAGLAAAAAAAKRGADVVLVDDGPQPGGRLLWEGGQEHARTLVAAAREAGVEILSSATALGHFDGLVAVWQGDTLHQIRARQHIYCTGGIEQPLVFAGNDLPGVMLSGGARRLSSLYGVSPGNRAVVVTVSDRGIRAALALQRAGVEIALVADLRPEPSRAAGRLASNGIEAAHGWTALAARGKKCVTGVTLTPVASVGRTSDRREIECDLIVVSGGDAPSTALLTHAGATTVYDEATGHFRLGELPAGLWAAGQVAGEGAWGIAAESGERAGLDVARALGLGENGSASRLKELRERLTAAAKDSYAVPPPAAGESTGAKAFTCFCEDVSAKDIHRSVEEGYDSIELSKRYTTVTMGPCQGKMCHLNSIRLMSRETGQSLGEVGTTTARPPWTTVPMGALAGRPIEAAKRSSIHHRHRELGAKILWAGDWRRPYDYGDPDGEVRAVHEAAGLIDVSTLGKLLVRGPQAGEFLDRLYPNRMSTIKPGRVRYGVLTSDAGRIMDDGTTSRLDDETFYVTTTSSGAGAVEQWFSWWLADWKMDVTLTDITQALSAVNLAGPKARDILSRLTDLDVSPEAFTYLDAKQARVAGVPCLLLRIGFVGELGYEIHFPAAYGEDLWDALLGAGAADGIKPFGLEPQRILRLQKQHIIVGQDTDSESNPFGAAMPWAVKLDKDEAFIGKWALERAAELDRETALVGFTLGNGFVPTEGSVVLGPDGTVAGQVTSARKSRRVGKVIGMAWVPASLATDGASITIADNGTQVQASVQTEPFYDPAGELLRS